MSLRPVLDSVHGPFKAFLTTALLVLMALLAGTAFPASAQFLSPTSLTPPSDSMTDEVMRLLMQRSQGGQSSAAPLQPSIQIQNPPVYSPPYRPAANRPEQMIGKAEELSPLERLMTARVGQRVQQFGYDLFGRGAPVIVRQSGALQDNYIMGTGDEIVVTLRGQQNAAYRARVDRDGRLLVPGVSPISASGRSFGALRADLESEVARSFVGTSVDASIGEVRQLSVRVVGEVNTPGVFSLTGLSTALDALNLAGGVKKTGSLRNIKIVRRNHTIPVDIYALMTDRSARSDVTLAEGDRIVVPLYTVSAAVVGQVKRPAIYEFADGQPAMRISDLLELAGGPQVRGAYRFSILRTREDGRRELVQVQSESSALIRDGDALFVDSTADVSLEKVELLGSVTLSGSYALDSARTLHAILKSSDIFLLKPGQPLPYLLIGGILRIDSATLQRVLVPFSPIDVLAGKSDVTLQSNDIIYVINSAEMRYIAAVTSAAQEAAIRRQPNLEPPANRDEQQAPAQRSEPQRRDTIQANADALQSVPGQDSNLLSGDFGTGNFTTGDIAGGNIAGSNIATGNVLPGYGNQLIGNLAGTGVVPNSIGFDTEALLEANRQSEDDGLPKLNGIADPFDANGNLISYDPRLRSGPETQGNSGVSPNRGSRTQPQLPQSLRTVPRKRLFAGIDDEQRQLLVGTLGNYYVTVSGEVNHPGAFLAMSDTTLDKIVQAAGGLTAKVDLKAFEITSAAIDNRSGTSSTIRKTYDIAADQFSKIALRPYDRVRFNPVFSDRDDGEVTLYGELRFPGNYEILRGERLSSVLARAGGFTDAAYPYGAIFLRRSVAEQERLVLHREADTLQSQVVALLGTASTQNAVTPTEVQYVSQLADRLRQAQGEGGRVAIQLDPKTLAGHPELDVVLEPGDRLYIPRKPNSVIVAGEVMSPSGIQYRDKLTVKSYIEQAGGVTDIADEGHIFVIQPDGSAVQASEGGWLGESTSLAPGSVIVVPRDLRPFSFDRVFSNIIQTTSQLAVTAASLSVIAAHP